MLYENLDILKYLIFIYTLIIFFNGLLSRYDSILNNPGSSEFNKFKTLNNEGPFKLKFLAFYLDKIFTANGLAGI